MGSKATIDMDFIREMARKTSESMSTTGNVSQILLELAASTFSKKGMIPSAYLDMIAFECAKSVEEQAENPVAAKEIEPGIFDQKELVKTAHKILLKCKVRLQGDQFKGFIKVVAREATVLAKMKSLWCRPMSAKDCRRLGAIIDECEQERICGR